MWWWYPACDPVCHTHPLLPPPSLFAALLFKRSSSVTCSSCLKMTAIPLILQSHLNLVRQKGAFCDNVSPRAGTKRRFCTNLAWEQADAGYTGRPSCTCKQCIKQVHFQSILSDRSDSDMAVARKMFPSRKNNQKNYKDCCILASYFLDIKVSVCTPTIWLLFST